MNLSGIDAEDIDNAAWSKYDVVFVYGSSFGSTQGPARRTPDAVVRAIVASGKPVWAIYFPGADPAQASIEAKSWGCVGIVCDVESKFEGDPWTMAQAAHFGGQDVLPSVIYSHQSTCHILGAHYNGLWYAGEPRPNYTLPPGLGIQWGYYGAYDVSDLSDWYANPRGSHPMSATKPIACFAVTPTYHGYACFDAVGGYYPVGDAPSGPDYSLAGKLAPGVTVRDMCFVPGGLIACLTDGGVFKFGSAATDPVLGSLPGFH